jgi:membrane-associated phospholipid phosphatase
MLLPHGYRRADQSFPSGHVALAMSIACALILVVPPRWRGAVAVVVAVPASVVASATIVAGWHRPGDVLGSDLIVLAVTSLAIVALAATGSLHSGHNRISGPTRRVPWWLLVATALVMGIRSSPVSRRRPTPRSRSPRSWPWPPGSPSCSPFSPC